MHRHKTPCALLELTAPCQNFYMGDFKLYHRVIKVLSCTSFKISVDLLSHTGFQLLSKYPLCIVCVGGGFKNTLLLAVSMHCGFN